MSLCASQALSPLGITTKPPIIRKMGDCRMLPERNQHWLLGGGEGTIKDVGHHMMRYMTYLPKENREWRQNWKLLMCVLS